MLEPDEEDDDFNVLKVSLRLMTNHDGTTDKNMLKLLKKRKNSPEFNDFVDFANIFSGKKNIVHILDDLWRVRKDFYEFLGKQGSNNEDYANSIFAVDDILKNAVRTLTLDTDTLILLARKHYSKKILIRTIDIILEGRYETA